MTRRHSSIVSAAIAGLLLVGADCSSNGDECSKANSTRVPSTTTIDSAPSSTSVDPPKT